ncbi:MAG: methionine synthase [Oligoflexia bacterium]|nr:methionine synthase [Oligoflexia bacterium]
MSKFLDRLKEKVIVEDGAMGTMIQGYALTPDDFEGLDGCNEYLVVTRPKIIKEIHSAYFEVGADAVQSNTFGSSVLVLNEYDIGDRAFELSKKAAQLAREAADDFSSTSWPRFVYGSVGPTTKLLTLGHVTFDQMYDSYMPQMLGMLEGGVDLIQIETCQDILQIKCAVAAAVDAMKKFKRRVPIAVTITVETSGTMLIGTEVQAALVVLETLPIDIVGLNCATGPDLMQENVRFLGKTSSRPIAILPNAGLPRNDGGRAVYDLTPEALADYQEVFVKDYGVSIVGGCCGTTPRHIKELVERVGGLAPFDRPHDFPSQVSSTYSAVPLDQDGSSPLIVGERCNANGSKQFKELLLKEDWEGIVEMGRQEIAEGAHVLDLCTAFVGRDETRDMREVLSRFSSQVTAPLMIDSTQVDVLESALKLVGGRPIINSINLEDGEGKFDRICELAVKFGAALVALVIDEEGMAKTAQRKLAVAQRIYDLCTKRHGIPGDALIYDPLTFTIGSGDEDSRKAAIETLEGIRLIKQHIPLSRTIVGLSNVSFGLKPYPRQILNSVFLSEAIKAGLDACIVHSRKILPIHKISDDLLQTTLDLIYDRRADGYDPLFVFIEKLQGAKGQSASDETADDGPVEEVLKRRIIEGRKVGIEQQLDRALQSYSALEIVNKILLDGMKVVGDLFGSGEMQLPFVLQSAETMKKAVAYLQQFMEKSGGPLKGCMVIATVKGDVHDIGKNLVDIILSNNGYKVVNLGIKQNIDAILASAEEHQPNAIGMSGLLVKSTWVMKENLELMSAKGWKVPVICGGAALNRAYVEVDLRRAYSTGPVYYGADAFTGLRLMDELTGQVTEKKLTTQTDERTVRHGEMRAEREARLAEKSQEYAASGTRILDQREIPKPPFWGVRYVTDKEISLAEIFPYINKKALYANQWMYRRGKKTSVEYREMLKNIVEPKFQTWCQRVLERGWIQPKVVYGYFPCQSEKNSLIIYAPEDPKKRVCQISFPRQVADKRRCIADYFLPVSSGRMDVVAFHVVTAGALASEKCQELFKSDQYTDYLHFYGLSVETAEALAEYWHRKVRHELGIGGSDGQTIDALFRQSYHGARYSFGYPACPNLEDQRHIFDLLKPEKIGVELSSEYQLVPEQSTSAIIVHHPEACYYSI